MPRKGHTEEQIVYALRQGRGGQESRRYLSRSGRFPTGFPQLEATLRRSRVERVAGTAAATRGKSQAEEPGGRPDSGQAHIAGGAIKKGLRPAARRELVRGIRLRMRLCCVAKAEP